MSDDESGAKMTKGIIKWFNKEGHLFGYIETEGGKEVYFDASSFSPGHAGRDSHVGAEVAFDVDIIDVEETAVNIRFIKARGK